MKGMKYGIGSDGTAIVVLMIEGNIVRLVSQDPKFSGLNGKAMALKVSDEVGSVTVDGTKMVKPGETGYPDAVVDTLEEMGIDVVG